MTTTAPPAELTLTPPNRIACGTRTASAGATVWLALQALLRAPAGRLSTPALCRAVWGHTAVPARTVWSLCHRANVRLTRVGAAARCGVDGDDVVLL